MDDLDAMIAEGGPDFERRVTEALDKRRAQTTCVVGLTEVDLRREVAAWRLGEDARLRVAKVRAHNQGRREPIHQNRLAGLGQGGVRSALAQVRDQVRYPCDVVSRMLAEATERATTPPQAKYPGAVGVLWYTTAAEQWDDPDALVTLRRSENSPMRCNDERIAVLARWSLVQYIPSP